MDSDLIFKIPILPLPNVVFFPHTVIPMVIAEPSYVRMIKDCIRNDDSLAIAMAEPLPNETGGPLRYYPRQIATMGKPMLLEEKEDGSIKILLNGQERVELLNVEQNIPYLVYSVKLMPDFECKKQSLFYRSELEKLRSLLLNWIDDTIDDSLERETFLDSLESLNHVIDYICLFLIQDRLMKQILLENRSLHERIQLLNSLFKGHYDEGEDELVAIAVKNFEDFEQEIRLVH